MAAISAYGAADSAHACETVQMCVSWTQVANEDAPYGDLVTASTYPARGARVTVIRPYPEPAVGMFLDENGCGSFDSQFAAGHKAVVYAEAVLGFGTSAQIHIETYADEMAKENGTDSFFQVDIPPIPEDWSVDIEVPDDGGHLVTLLATATETIHRLHALDGSLLSGGRELDIWLDPTRQNASAPFGEIRVGTAGTDQGVSAIGKKFILGHEIGHWIQEEITGDSWDFHYGYPAMDEPCQFAVEYVDPLAAMDTQSHPDLHGIRSAEYASGAMPEGFGHFVAAVAFNSDLGADADGEFRYYKDPDETVLPSYEGFEDDDRVVSLLGGAGPGVLGGPDRWVEIECLDDWNHPLQPATLDEEISSEIDWLRLFWRFVTAPYTPQSSAPTFWDTVHLVTFTQQNHAWNNNDHVLWPNMLDAVTNGASGLSAYEQRFEDLSAAHGVYNDGP